ncbi:MAG TPA: hypothetical protein VK509_24265, partial [Polyangiales bacterium]|nr:hypothetical protein [Polyangiales bacterium]
MYISDDDGRSWRRPDRGVPETGKVYAIAVHANAVYGATSNGVYRSALDARAWSAVGGLEGSKVLSLAAIGGELFAGSD